MPAPQRFERLRLVVLTPFDMERNGHINGYRIGSYPFEGSGRSDRYAPPGRLHRHQYGDAADVWVDKDGDGDMDDLNGDRKRDTRDARVMLGNTRGTRARW